MNKKQTERAIKAEIKNNDIEIKEIYAKWPLKWQQEYIKKTIKVMTKKSHRKLQQENFKVIRDKYFGIEPHSLIDALIGEAVTHAIILGGVWDIKFDEMQYMATRYSSHSWETLQEIIKQVKAAVETEDLVMNIKPSEDFLRKNRTRIRNFKLNLKDRRMPVVPHINQYIDKKMTDWEKKHRIRITGTSDVDLEPVRKLFPRLADVEYSRVTDFTLLGKLEFTVTELDEALKELLEKDYEKEFVRRARDIITRIKTYKGAVIESVYEYDVERKEYEFKKAIEGYEEAIELSLRMTGLKYTWENFGEVKSYLTSLKLMSKGKYRHELAWLREAASNEKEIIAKAG